MPTRLPLDQVNPGQQVLDTQAKLITHAIRIAAFNIDTALARAVRVQTNYARADDLTRQALTASGDIDPHDGFLTVRLDPLPTRRATTAIAELCEHLTATQTCYPGTNLVLRYEVKTAPDRPRVISHVQSPEGGETVPRNTGGSPRLSSLQLSTDLRAQRPQGDAAPWCLDTKVRPTTRSPLGGGGRGDCASPDHGGVET